MILTSPMPAVVAEAATMAVALKQTGGWTNGMLAKHISSFVGELPGVDPSLR